MIKLRQDEVNCPEFPWIECIIAIFHIDQSVFRVLTVNLHTMVSLHSFPLILCKCISNFYGLFPLWLLRQTIWTHEYFDLGIEVRFWPAFPAWLLRHPVSHQLTLHMVLFPCLQRMLFLLLLVLQSPWQSLLYEAIPTFSRSFWDTQDFLFSLDFVTTFKNTSFIGSYLSNLRVEIDIGISPNRFLSVEIHCNGNDCLKANNSMTFECGITTTST